MVTSLATLPLVDASRDSRIHDWIAEQYSFALSEFQDDLPWRDDPPSLRESKLLPDDFDIIPRPSPPSHRGTDSDGDTHSAHFYDPPLLPSPLPLLHDAPLQRPTPQDNTNLEDAFNGLLREMDSWCFVSARRSALTSALSNRNKVCLHLSSLFLLPGSHVSRRHFQLHLPHLRHPLWKTSLPCRRPPPHHRLLPLSPLLPRLLSDPFTGARNLSTAATPLPSLTRSPLSPPLRLMRLYVLAQIVILQSLPRSLQSNLPLLPRSGTRYMSHLRRHRHRPHLTPQPLPSVLRLSRTHP
jgi:hypothetical protein